MLGRFLDLVLPSRCVVCARGSTAFCRACRDGVAPIDRVALGGIEVRVCGAYDGALRTAVLAFKHGRRDAGVALADFLAERLPLGPEAGILVPVPTAAVRRRERGFDQAELLASELARHTGVPSLHLLRRVGSDSQNGRARARRLEATGRFALESAAGPRLLAGTRAVVVDDVVTTGATLRDAIETLERSGLAVAGAFAVARAFPQPGGFREAVHRCVPERG